jgi:hypothetical protein
VLIRCASFRVKSEADRRAVQQVLKLESVTFNNVEAAVFTPLQAVLYLLNKKPAAAPRCASAHLCVTTHKSTSKPR